MKTKVFFLVCMILLVGTQGLQSQSDAFSVIDVPKKYSELDTLLCQVYKDDQSIRKEAYKMFQVGVHERINLQQKIDSIDTNNQKIVFGILDSIGWPNNLSDMANRGIFIVIDHSNLESQKKYLPLVKEQSQKGTIEKGGYATLLERVLMKSNEKQIYGTQTITRQKDGKTILYVWPIQNPTQIDSLRKSVDLPPMDDYIKLVSSVYKQPCKWDKDLEINDFK